MKHKTKIKYKNKECTMCHKIYSPTQSRQKRCSKCGPKFEHVYDEIYKKEYRIRRQETRLVESAKSKAKKL